VLLGYVLIIALKLQRLAQEVAELVELAQKRRDAERKAVPVG
jgi:hypothetical protein